MYNLRFFLLFFIFDISYFYGNTEKYYFKHLGLEQGLSQSSVLCILQDHTGFMWFGTKDGLNRYDGNSFKIFQYKYDDPTSLGNNVINSLFEMKNGEIWIGTDAGIYIYNPKSECFSYFSTSSQDGTKITQPVYKITSDSKGNVWIVVESQGIFCFKNKGNKLIHYPIKKPNNVSYLEIDYTNTIWVGYKGEGLYYTNDNFKTFNLFTDSNNINIFADDYVFKIMTDNHNHLYIGSSKGGLKRINVLTKTVTNILPNTPDHLQNIFVRNILRYSDSKLWIATESGIYIYDTANKVIQHIEHNRDDVYSLSDNAIYDIYKDNEGGIWIGSYFGGIDYYPLQFTNFDKYYPLSNKNSLSGKIVREFCEDNNGNLWIGTEDGGLNKFNPTTKQFRKFENKELYHNIHALCMDNNTLWIGTYSKGLHALDLNSNKIKHYAMGHSTNSLNDNNIYSMCKTSSGDLYIGTPTGLNKYNHAKDDFTRIEKMGGIFIFDILEDHNGIIWFATYNSGVFKYNPRNQTWKNYSAQSTPARNCLPYNKVISIMEDSKGRLWFTMQGRGFCSFNPESEIFTNYDISQGLANDVIYQIIEDKNETFWLTSNKGLILFDLPNKTFKIFTTQDGLLNNQFNYCSSIKTQNGDIYLGGINGFISFNSRQFTENKYYPPVVLTEFYLFNKKADINAKDSPLKTSISFTERLDLKYNQNSFAFKFAALGYSTSGTNQLQYKLEGFDKEWYTTDSNNPVATYTNLKPGSYTFSVKSSNYQGEWNGETKSIRVQIHPPFWKSTWAYILYIIVTSGLIIYSIYRFRKRMIDKQKLQFERLESEKEKELYHAKIDFFTNIAHEIRTPLTLIKGPLENILKKNDLNEKEVKENLNIMEQNTLRLLNLTNQLLDFRKTETKGFSLNFMTYNISEILKETYNRFLPTAKQNYLEFNLQLPEKDFYAPVDKEALTKILSNLFNNAVKYAQSNIIAQLDIQPESNPNMFMITVSNDGTLIPKDMEEDIFKPFVQIKNTDNGQRTAGTGIGLPLARSLAELHKGKLYLKNEDQICFCVELPITQENVIQLSKHYIEDSPNIPDRHLATTPENQNTILVIDDDPEILSFVSKQLQNTYKIITATNGKEALDILETESVNLIVSDVMMPEIDGFELCKRLKNNINYSHIPIILLTARATLQSKIEGIELGADAYIEKPFSTEYLLVKIATLLTNLEKLRKAFTSSPFVEARTIALSNADEKFLDKLTETIKKNISEPEFNVDILASEMNMSRSSLHRKIKSIAQITPNEYIQLERLKTAAQLLQSGNYKINEICYIVGFNSSSYFAKCFQKQFGVLPKEFCSSIRN